MNWKELLSSEIENAYKVTDGLLDLVDDSTLGWKPSSGSNWMTTGQLLMHISNACGQPMRGFITGDWGMPGGVEMKDLPPEEMIPPAEKLLAVESVAQARELLAQDRQLSLKLLASCDENELAAKMVSAPWDPTARNLGSCLLEMVEHQNQHRSQLFYYLKLQGKSVNTVDLWGV